MRVVAGLLANVFWNYLRLIVKTRVEYDMETFKYEEYRQRGQSDKRLLKNAIFQSSKKCGAKLLVADFYKFQKDLIEEHEHESQQQFQLFLLDTPDKIKLNLNCLVQNLTYLR